MKPRFLLLALLLCSTATPALAQAPAPSDWDAPRALELIRRAQDRRAETFADTGLTNYRSDARIFVYFYLDREDTEQRNLVKTDQLALEVFWEAPDRVKQRIVGWRDEKSLPNNIRYHLDHLTVVQENFGDEIVLGDGDEVRGVRHPAARGAESVYEYRLADSLTLRLPGAPEPVRVYELRVRPRDRTEAAFVGAVFVDRRAGDIVRMDFTFTPTAYVDRYLDYINISLENGLWDERFWLPNQQRVEIRRRIPQLDIPAGSIIRATMRISNYEFNQQFPQGTFDGPSVVALPPSLREAFPFEEDLHAELREEGLGPQVELHDIRGLAAELVRARLLQSARGVQIYTPSGSQSLRYNRAEGLAIGAGVSTHLEPGVRASAHGGWAFGVGHPFATMGLDDWRGEWRRQGRLYANRGRELGLGPVGSGAAATLSALFAAHDPTDLYFASGSELTIQRALSPRLALGASARLERHRSASLASEFAFLGGEMRAVRPIDPADLFLAGDLEIQRKAPAGLAVWWDGAVGAEAGVARLDPSCPAVCPAGEALFMKPSARVAWGRRWTPALAELSAELRTGAAFGDLPRQELPLIGGWGTLPGYELRSFAGDRFVLARAVAGADLLRPMLRGRLSAGLGWTALSGAGVPPAEAMGVGSTGGLRPSVGAGIGIFHDIVRLDVARGFGSPGRWELILEANPSFWDFL